MSFPPVRRQQALLLGLLFLAAWPPYCHYTFLRTHFDSARIFHGLLPLEFLTLRWFGGLSLIVVAGIAVALFASFAWPSLTSALLLRCTAIFLLFTVAYLCIALFIIAFYVLHAGT